MEVLSLILSNPAPVPPPKAPKVQRTDGGLIVSRFVKVDLHKTACSHCMLPIRRDARHIIMARLNPCLKA